MFKRKIWTEVERYFTPPYSGNAALRAWGNTERYAFGFTTIVFKDQYGNIKTEIIIGNATKNLR